MASKALADMLCGPFSSRVVPSFMTCLRNASQTLGELRSAVRPYEAGTASESGTNSFRRGRSYTAPPSRSVIS